MSRHVCAGDSELGNLGEPGGWLISCKLLQFRQRLRKLVPRAATAQTRGAVWVVAGGAMLLVNKLTVMCVGAGQGCWRGRPLGFALQMLLAAGTAEAGQIVDKIVASRVSK